MKTQRICIISLLIVASGVSMANKPENGQELVESPRTHFTSLEELIGAVEEALKEKDLVRLEAFHDWSDVPHIMRDIVMEGIVQQFQAVTEWDYVWDEIEWIPEDEDATDPRLTWKSVFGRQYSPNIELEGIFEFSWTKNGSGAYSSWLPVGRTKDGSYALAGITVEDSNGKRISVPE